MAVEEAKVFLFLRSVRIEPSGFPAASDASAESRGWKTIQSFSPPFVSFLFKKNLLSIWKNGDGELAWSKQVVGGRLEVGFWTW